MPDFSQTFQHYAMLLSFVSSRPLCTQTGKFGFSKASDRAKDLRPQEIRWDKCGGVLSHKKRAASLLALRMSLLALSADGHYRVPCLSPKLSITVLSPPNPKPLSN